MKIQKEKTIGTSVEIKNELKKVRRLGRVAVLKIVLFVGMTFAYLPLQDALVVLVACICTFVLFGMAANQGPFGFFKWIIRVFTHN